MGLFKGSEGNVGEQLKKIMDHLGFLEKKIDQLIEQSGNRSQGFGRRPSGGGYGGGFNGGGYRGNRESSGGGNREFGGNRDPRDHYRSRRPGGPRGYGNRPNGGRHGGNRPNGNFGRGPSSGNHAPAAPRETSAPQETHAEE